MTSTIKVGLIGFGNVGQGVHSIINTNQSMITKRIGQALEIKSICVRNPKKYAHINTSIPFTTNPEDIINDPEIDIIVEVIGGENPAYQYITQALNNKKYVVTANKELIAKHKQTFFSLAKKNNVDIFFEASVGGGIPIIKSFKVGYGANQIESAYGILNGTTNFILTKLFENKQDFQTVLKEAQDLGFAEADPTSDISGLDAAYKIVILTAVALKADIQIEDVYYEGIEHITLEDALYLDELGYRIRLIAKAKHENNGLSVTVYPTAILKDHPLAMVRNEFNAIFCTGNMVGESMIYGKGAGSLPTGSAVVSDILDIAFDINKHQSRRNLETSFSTLPINSIDHQYSQFYFRILLKDEIGSLEELTHLFNQHNINLKKVIQKDTKNNQAEVVIVTDTAQEKTITALKKEITTSEHIVSIESIIRVGL